MSARSTRIIQEDRGRHVPVLQGEVVRFLARPNATLIDGTIGDGGHAVALLDASGEGARLLGIDLDQQSLARAAETLHPYGSRVRLVHDTFARIAEIADRGNVKPNGVLFDLGMSTYHLDVERGFSFNKAGPLDMRFDATGAIALPAPEMPALRRLARRMPAYTAADVLADLRADELTEVLRVYGEERFAHRIANTIVTERRIAPIDDSQRLVRIIVRAFPAPARHGRIHAATRTFQALRIAVNREFETLREGVRGALSSLVFGGRCAVIAFHSGEDRIIKHAFRDAAKSGEWSLLTKHPLRPSREEQVANPRSRSARLRVIGRAK